MAAKRPGGPVRSAFASGGRVRARAAAEPEPEPDTAEAVLEAMARSEAACPWCGGESGSAHDRGCPLRRRSGRDLEAERRRNGP